MSDNDKKTLIEFPCHFPVKVVGDNTESFNNDIEALSRDHFAEAEFEIKRKASKNERYISLTITVYVQNQEQLDAFYKAVSKHAEVKMVL